MWIQGVFYVLVNVLWILMSIAGPTPVAGTNGTTAAMVNGARVEAARLR